jgi:hypothetical protein
VYKNGLVIKAQKSFDFRAFFFNQITQSPIPNPQSTHQQINTSSNNLSSSIKAGYTSITPTQRPNNKQKWLDLHDRGDSMIPIF